MKESKNIIKALSEAIDSGRDAALVTVISVAGSTPRETAAKMIVYADASIEGTIGGGGFEALAIKQAVECVKKRKGGKFSFELTPKGIGALCMGRMEIFIDVYNNPLKVLILGAGHVGQKIYEVCHAAGYPCAVADDRQEFANIERFPHASEILIERPDRAVKPVKPDKNTYIVIVTRGHALDRECLRESMKTRAAYIGMIGSAEKVGETFRILGKKKIYPSKDSRVHSPIGLNIGGKTPGEIAISVLAEIIKLHYGRDGRHMKIV
ncbi:MAG: XdhC family protein [Elusimicrobia bacterium]|nr:XdhC family protein [Elusimicrobiota bacterium]